MWDRVQVQLQVCQNIVFYMPLGQSTLRKYHLLDLTNTFSVSRHNNFFGLPNFTSVSLIDGS